MVILNPTNFTTGICDHKDTVFLLLPDVTPATASDSPV